MTVYISRKSYRSMCYHTNPDCPRLPDRHRPIETNQLNSTYAQCEVCADEYDNGGGNEQKTCPFCGETVGKIPPHLPCEGVE